jgi:hypothetical protein
VEAAKILSEIFPKQSFEEARRGENFARISRENPTAFPPSHQRCSTRFHTLQPCPFAPSKSPGRITARMPELSG